MSETIDFRKRPLVFIDLETTGLDPNIHEIVEIACLVTDGKTFEIKKQYTEKVAPEHIETASLEALKIFGYSPQEWENARPPMEVLQEVNQLAPGGMLAGWNVSFDWWFLEMGFKKYGITSQFDYHALDVASIAYAKLYTQEKIKEIRLRKVASYFGIELPEEHGAFVDILATYEIFKKLMEK